MIYDELPIEHQTMVVFNSKLLKYTYPRLENPTRGLYLGINTIIAKD
jgi:hypothetical protein